MQRSRHAEGSSKCSSKVANAVVNEEAREADEAEVSTSKVKGRERTSKEIK